MCLLNSFCFYIKFDLIFDYQALDTRFKDILFLFGCSGYRNIETCLRFKVMFTFKLVLFINIHILFAGIKHISNTIITIAINMYSIIKYFLCIFWCLTPFSLFSSLLRAPGDSHSA